MAGLKTRARRALSLLLILTSWGGVGCPSHAARSASEPQDIVLILTDDQRWDSLRYMPNVRALLMANGRTFLNAFENNPLCCPTRTTIMTGLTSGHNGVWTNNGSTGGFDTFLAEGDQNRQIFDWLHDAGYQTALIGKFLNGYLGPGNGSDIGFTMPGVDDWQALLLDGIGRSSRSDCLPQGYWGTCYSNNGTLQREPRTAYSTTTSGNKAVRFIDEADPNRPLFLYYAPRAPHQPTIPEPRFAGACPHLPRIRGPSYNRPIVHGPLYMRRLPAWSAGFQRLWDGRWKNDCRTLRSVDDQVGRIVQALQHAGRLENTLLLFASDNGFAFGEHRWAGKTVPYDPSIRIPVIVRDDALIPSKLRGTTVADQITSLDYTSTFLAAAGVSRNLDGQSLFPLLTGAGRWVPQNDVLIEHQGVGSEEHVNVPAYCGVRTAGYMYSQYATGEEELYDLSSDPSELTNVAADPRYTGVLRRLRTETHRLCDPTPPGFTWTH